MELYGSLLNISGSVTASTFTGSFIGDGSGLTGIQAAGVVGLNLSQIATGSLTASLSPNGFNVNTDTSITGSVNITGSISLNGEPIGTGKLNETTFQAYTSSNDGRVAALETSSGSLNSFTSSIDTTIKSKLDNDGVISGSIQVDITGTTGYSTFSSSISSSIGDISSSIATTTNNLSTSIATTDLNQTNRLISIENKTGSYATTGSNLFIGTQTHSGSIIPSVDNEYDLGSVTHQWRDVYISSGSLYIDGTKVISSTAQELQITTDNGQSIKILEGGTDSIILQTADGNVELKSNADGDILLDPTNGKIVLKGTIEVLNGQKIQSSVGGTPIVFANDIVVSGSIDITGTIEGINLTDFSSSVNTRVSNLESGAGSLNAFTASATTRLNSLETTTGSLNSYTSSNNTRLGVIETSTSSLNSFTSSINTTIKDRLNSEGIISGSIQVNVTETTGYSTFSSSIATTDLNQTNRLNSIEGVTGSYATTGSNIFIGNQTITGSLFISQNLIVQGSSSLENITASAVSIGTNTIILNTDSPAFRYAGISVFDSGSTNVTASLFYDSLTNQWKFKHSDVGTSDASILLFGPLGSDIDNTPLLASNYLTKVEGTNDHGHHITSSNIFDNGSKVSINSNTEITGTLRVTGTALVSGSSQVLNGSGVFSGSAQLPAGLVSGSSQVLAGTTIHSGSFFNGISVVSGSGQISFNGITDKPALVSGSSQISFSSIADKPALVSGSSQITYTDLSNIPGNIVSGSIQIDLTATTNYSTGIKTRLNAEGVISGSSQVTNIGNPQLVNPSFHVGTTSISLGRASASQTLTGVSIDGNADTVDGLHETSFLRVSTSSSSPLNGNFAIGSASSRNFIQSHSGQPLDINPLGNAVTVGSGLSVTGAISASNFSGTSSGTNTGDQTSVSGNAGTTSQRDFSGDISTSGMGRFTGWYTGNAATGLAAEIGISAAQAYIIAYNRQTSTYGAVNIESSTATLRVSGSTVNVVTGALQQGGNQVLHAGNFGSYALPLSGGTMTGIIVTVSSGTAINFSGQSDSFGYNATSGQGTYIKGTSSTYIYGGGTFYDGSTVRTLLHSGNFTSYAMSGAGFSANQNLNTNSNVTFNSVTGAITSAGSGDGNAPFRFGADYSGWMSLAAGTPGSNNGWGLFWAGNSGAQYGTNGTSGPGNIWSNADNPNEYVFVGNGGSRMSIYGNNGNVWMGGDVRMDGNVGVGGTPALKFHVRGAGEMVRFENTSTGTNEYTQLNFRAGSRNGYIWLGNQNSSSWAGDGGLNIYTDFGNMDFWTNALQRTRITRVSGALLHGDVTVGPDTNAWLGTAVFGVSGYNKVIIGSLNSSTTGAYVGGHNSALSAWANLNIAGEAIIFRYQQTERARFDTSGNFIPGANNAYNLGSASLGWANVYTNDLHLSNMNKPEGNDVDGTNGNWTIQEGAENLYIINNNNGKKFKIKLEEI
jgi:hypothetical protein